MLESPSDSKEIQPVHLKGNQSWIFFGRTDAEAETNTLATWCEELTHLKRPWCWERLKAGGEGDDRGWDGGMASPIQWTWVWVSSGNWWWTGKPGMLQSMRSQRVMTEQLNWLTDMLDVLFHLTSYIFTLIWHKKRLRLSKMKKNPQDPQTMK